MVQAILGLVGQYAEGVQNISGPPPSRRGCAAALGVLPCQLLMASADHVLQALATGIKVLPTWTPCIAALCPRAAAVTTETLMQGQDTLQSHLHAVQHCSSMIS